MKTSLVFWGAAGRSQRTFFKLSPCSCGYCGSYAATMMMISIMLKPNILGDLARGAFGRVEVVAIGENTVARKVFDPLPEVLNASDEDKLLKRFRREVTFQSKFGSLHPTLFMPVIDTYLSDNPPWFVMPLAERTLTDEIKAARDAGTIPQDALGDILNGLEELHGMGFVHRDLKPANILLHDGTWKLADFGLILPANPSNLTSAMSKWGADAYCAPEQMLDFHGATASADIYSFGCILHDIVGEGSRVPFQSYSASGPLGSIIERCTAADPRARFKNVTSLRAELMSVLESVGHSPPSPTTVDWLQRISSTEPWSAADIQKLSRFVTSSEATASVLWSVFDALNDDRIAQFGAVDEYATEIVGLAYARWTRETGFSYVYCDVVAQRLLAFFRLGSPPVQVNCGIAAALLGRRYNRWYVMRKVLMMCGLSLDDRVATGIAVEIELDETLADAFRGCAGVINQPLATYHSRITAAVGVPLYPFLNT